MSDRIPAALQERLDLVSSLDRASRIDALISVAERFKPVPPEIASKPYDESHRVPGCESGAFVWAVPRKDGALDFYFDVENPQGISARALAVIMGETLSGSPLAEVARVGDDIVYAFFGNELSMGKSMGLTAMVGVVRTEAQRRLS